MLRGDQFIKSLFGQLEVDEQKVTQFMLEFSRDYPFGEVRIDRKNFDLSVRCKGMEEGKPLCMKCGSPLISRVNQRRKNGTWQPLKRKDHLSNWECPKCYLNGFAPLIVGAGLAATKDVEEEIEARDRKFREEYPEDPEFREVF